MKVKSESEVAQVRPEQSQHQLSLSPLNQVNQDKANHVVGLPRWLAAAAAAAAKLLQSCPTLSDPMDCSLPVSSVHGIFQARVLEWVAIAFSEHMPLHIN